MSFSHKTMILVSFFIHLAAVSSPKYRRSGFRRRNVFFSKLYNGSKFRRQDENDDDANLDFKKTEEEETTTQTIITLKVPASLEQFLAYTDHTFTEPWNEGDFYYGKKPNTGYDPYWLNGDKLFDIFTTTPSTTTQSKTTNKHSKILMCGQDCPEMYILYGPICGRNTEYDYKSFVNYCDMMNEDCPKLKGWRIAYKGQCHEDVLKVYPTNHVLLPKLADEYLDDFERNYRISHFGQKPKGEITTTLKKPTQKQYL